MLHARINRLATLGLLAVYVTASTLGGLFHDHAHVADGCCTIASACHDHHDAADDHDEHEHAAACEHCGDSRLLGDDECCVCRFLGQRTTPVEPAAFVAVSDACTDVAIACPVQMPASFPRTLQSRAPPSAS
jgi:hypothetical protein